jgi:aarF domain-containing kinase
MRPVLAFSRLCLRSSLPRLKPSSCHIRSFRTTFSRQTGGNWQYPRKPRGGTTILWAAAALSPAVFVQLSEKDNNGTEHTAETRMLAASREEIAKRLSDDDHGFSRFRHGIVLLIDVYIWEPICTGFRFLHLVVIFVPVILTVPAIWLGRRQKDRDDERSGTLWWYWFLVNSMERAGPAFIKVILFLHNLYAYANYYYLAGTMGCLKVRYFPYRDVRRYVTVALKCTSTFAQRD